MKTILMSGFALALLAGAAQAQCNPSIAGTCSATDPAIAGAQQLQQSQATQQREMNMQNQQLQSIQRGNMQRYESGTVGR
jgi:hypothetical protein